MMEAKGKSLLKVVSILLIVFGAIAALVTLFGTLLVGILGGAAMAAGAVGEGALVIVACLIALAASTIDLIAGIVGVKNCDKPEKAQTCFIFGIVMIAVQVISAIMSIASNEFNFFTTLFGLVLPVLYTVGAVQNKQSVEA